MSYTNQTQHYGLPQYVGTDVPAWLTDVNSAFATIDQGMNAAKTQADRAATAAGQAANDIVSINSTLGTQAGQISAVASAVALAQTTANDADGKADTNAQSIDGIDRRVAALEASSSSGIETETVTIPASTPAYQYIPPTGKIPAAVTIKTGAGEQAGLGVILLHNAAGSYTIVQVGAASLTAGAGIVIATVPSPIEVIVTLENAS